MSGYLHPDYAFSLAEFGSPQELPRSKGWILSRPIPGSPHQDAMGCYPLFSCKDWSMLNYDLEELENTLVTLSLVTDPFGAYDETYLQQCFRDVVTRYKKHYIVDLRRPVDEIVCKHHRYYARKALKSVSIEECPDPTLLLEEWLEFYSNLMKKHKFKGIKAFSKKAFLKQMNTPGMVMFRAISRDVSVGAHLWYLQGDVAHSHLAALSTQGYDIGASYALYWVAIEYFAQKGLHWLNLGSGAGVKSDTSDGLSQFKRGWATGTKTAYFCGRIFDHAKYSEIVKAKGIRSKDYFPAYRKGEFD